jgi:hypothetical protein
VAVLTGDNPQTAAAIAREVGLLGEGGGVLSGAELPEDDAVLGALVDRSDGVVISRVTPEDKLRIATALQHRGHVVAMTGDGVNDGPALQIADNQRGDGCVGNRRGERRRRSCPARRRLRHDRGGSAALADHVLQHGQRRARRGFTVLPVPQTGPG